MLWQGVCERQDNYYKKCDSSSVRVFDKTEFCLAAAVWAQLCCVPFQVKILNITLIFLLGKKLGYTFNNRNFHNVSLGQGQEVVAEQALDLAAKEGHWVILQVQCLWKQSCRSPRLPDADHLSKGSQLFLSGGRMGQGVICVSKATTF